MWKGIVFLIIIAAVVVGTVVITTEETQAPVADNNEQNNTITTMGNLTLTSPVFETGGMIPSQYTCDGEDVTPPLEISGVPEDAKSLAIVMDDPDAEPVAGKVWDHWVVWNIPTSTTEIAEGTEPEGVHGIGTSGNTDYHGPCPPDKAHTYHFKLYALDTDLDLEEGSTKSELERRMEGHIIEETELIGVYDRN